MLGKYEVRPGDVQIGENVRKGYQRHQLWDAWQRYLFVAPESTTSATTQPPHDPACSGCSACSASPGDERQRESETVTVDLSVGRLV